MSSFKLKSSLVVLCAFLFLRGLLLFVSILDVSVNVAECYVGGRNVVLWVLYILFKYFIIER